MTINKRDAEEYFGRHQLVEDALAPFKVTDTLGSFDVIALCDGGGITGQSGALRLGIARAFSRLATTVPTSSAPASSPVTPASSSARSTASRRPVALLSSPSAKAFAKTFPVWKWAYRVFRWALFLYHYDGAEFSFSTMSAPHQTGVVRALGVWKECE